MTRFTQAPAQEQAKPVMRPVRATLDAECSDSTPCCTVGRLANWRDTSCLCDCHYPKIRASTMTRGPKGPRTER